VQSSGNFLSPLSKAILNLSTKTLSVLSLFQVGDLHCFSELDKNLKAADTPIGRDTSAMNANALLTAGL